VLRGMIDTLVLDLVQRHVVTDRIGLYIDYDGQSLQHAPNYQGAVVEDYYGRRVPKPVHANVALACPTASQHELRAAYQQLYQQFVRRQLLIRRVTVVANHLIDEQQLAEQPRYEQTNLFEDPEVVADEEQQAQRRRDRDRQLQTTILKLQQRSGNKNVIIRLADLKDGATTIERNDQIGGHRA